MGHGIRLHGELRDGDGTARGTLEWVIRGAGWSLPPKVIIDGEAIAVKHITTIPSPKVTSNV